MRVLAEIRWCETHGRRAQIGGCTGQRWKGCVVVDAQVTRTTTDPTPRPYKQCPDCDGYGNVDTDTVRGTPDDSCSSCSVGPKQTEQNIERAADIIRRNTTRTRDLVSIGTDENGLTRYGIVEWDDLVEKEQDAWVALARKVITEGTP